MEETPIQSQAPAPAVAPKKSNGMLLGLVLCIILAAGGVGFGVYEMMDSNNKTKEVADLNSKVASLNNEIAGLKEGSQSSETNCKDPIVTSDDNTISTDYIYITEWGIKIKKPESAKKLIDSYEFYNGYPMAADTFTITESGGSNGRIMLGPWSNDDNCKNDGNVCFKIGDQLFMVQESVGDLAPGEPSRISDEFRNYFFDSSNYSEI